MKKIKFLGVALTAVMFLASCGGGGLQEVEISPLKAKIKGDVGDFIEISNEKCKVVKSQEMGQDWVMTFKLKNIKTGDLNDENYDLDFKLVLTDKSGKPITGLKEFWMSDGLWGTASELKKLRALITESPGSEEWFTLPMDVDYGSDYEEYLPEGITNFTIRTEVKKVEIAEETSSDNSSSNESYSNSSSKETVSNEDWDAVLKSYESYIDQYIKLMKKAANGDASAMTEYASMMEKATDLSEKMSNAGDDLSVSQMTKFMKLQTKLTTAAAEMYN